MALRPGRSRKRPGQEGGSSAGKKSSSAPKLCGSRGFGWETAAASYQSDWGAERQTAENSGSSSRSSAKAGVSVQSGNKGAKETGSGSTTETGSSSIPGTG